MVNFQQYDLQSAFRLEKQMLESLGFYPQRTKTSWGYFSRKIIALCFSFLQLFSMMAQMVQMRNDLSKLTDNLLYFTTHLAFMLKLANFLHYKRTFFQIEDQLCHPIFRSFSETQGIELKSRMKSLKIVTMVFRLCCFSGVSFYGLTPMLENRQEAQEKVLPSPGWLPYDVQRPEYYAPTAAFQMISVSITAYINSCLDILVWVLISLCSGQLDILKDNLRNISYKQGEDSSAAAEEKLKRCIVHHKEIISLLTKIQEVFSKSIFLQFFASIIVICVTLFQTIFVSFFTFRSVFLFSYFCAMMTQVSMYCWYGNDIMITSEQISKSVFMSNWYESDVKLRKTMFIFMERLKKPVILAAGSFIPLSLTTLLSILRSSYSYFAVLQRLYKDI